MRDPRRDHYLGPAADADTKEVLDTAIETLATIRGLNRLGDATVDLHLLASLLAEARSRLPQAVADARDQECSWAEVADLLGVTRASAWQRYASRTASN